MNYRCVPMLRVLSLDQAGGPVMKPHLSLHVTKKGEWWVSQHTPTDRHYTLNGTMNFRTSADAVRAAVWLREFWPSFSAPVCVRQQHVSYESYPDFDYSTGFQPRWAQRNPV